MFCEKQIGGEVQLLPKINQIFGKYEDFDRPNSLTSYLRNLYRLDQLEQISAQKQKVDAETALLEERQNLRNMFYGPEYSK